MASKGEIVKRAFAEVGSLDVGKAIEWLAKKKFDISRPMVYKVRNDLMATDPSHLKKSFGTEEFKLAKEFMSEDTRLDVFQGITNLVDLLGDFDKTDYVLKVCYELTRLTGVEQILEFAKKCKKFTEMVGSLERAKLLVEAYNEIR